MFSTIFFASLRPLTRTSTSSGFETGDEEEEKEGRRVRSMVVE